LPPSPLSGSERATNGVKLTEPMDREALRGWSSDARWNGWVPARERQGLLRSLSAERSVSRRSPIARTRKTIPPTSSTARSRQATPSRAAGRTQADLRPRARAATLPAARAQAELGQKAWAMKESPGRRYPLPRRSQPPSQPSVMRKRPPREAHPSERPESRIGALSRAAWHAGDSTACEGRR
jgi:hypothetical protein